MRQLSAGQFNKANKTYTAVSSPQSDSELTQITDIAMGGGNLKARAIGETTFADVTTKQCADEITRAKQAEQSLQLQINSLSMLDRIWLVNEVKIFTDETDPNVKYPEGTFVKIAQGRTLIGADSSHTLGTTGGSADAVAVTHIHDGIIDVTDAEYVVGNGSGHSGRALQLVGSVTDYGNLFTKAAGESGVGKNMMPYLVVNYWKRVS